MERKILVADDDFLLRSMTMSQLEDLCKSLGIKANIDDATTGKEAVEKARAREYHLIVLDNNMESHDNGFNAILKIREFRPELPMILYTSGLDDVRKEAIMKKAGAEIVIKCGDVDLADAARKYLEAGE